MKPIKKTIFCFTGASFRSLGSFIALAAPNALLFCVEWWANELYQIVIVNAPKEKEILETEISVQILSLSVFMVCYSVNVGINIAGQILAAQYIGQGRKSELKKSTLLNLIIGLFIMIIVLILLFFFKSEVFKIFSSNPLVIEKGAEVLPWILLALILCSIKSALQGVITGMRKQVFGSIVSILSYYIPGIGLSIVFVVVLDWGVQGIWISISLAYGTIAVIFFIFIAFSDFDKIIVETQKAIKEDQEIMKRIMLEEEKKDAAANSKS